MGDQVRESFETSLFRIHLEDGPRVRPLKHSRDFWKRLGPEFDGGRMVAVLSITKAEELHPGTWEMHPEGDELLSLISGAIDVVLEGTEDESLVRLKAGESLVVPAGTWHRLLLRKPGLLLAVTRGQGTQLRQA